MQFYLTAIILGLCLAAMTIGIFISMKVFKIPDITTDGSYTLGAAVTALLLPAGLTPATALLVVIACGAFAGAITGLIHTLFKIDALLAGILTMTALYSVNLSIMGRSNIPLLDTDNVFNTFTKYETTEQQLLVSFLAIALLACLVVYLLKSDFGIAMRATGNNPVMAKSVSVNVSTMKITGLAIANALTAVSGFLVAQYQHFTDINMGIGIVIIGLGSVLIAEALNTWLGIRKISLQVAMVVAGSIIFQVVLAITLSLGVDPNLLKLVTALFVLAVVALPSIKLRNL